MSSRRAMGQEFHHASHLFASRPPLYVANRLAQLVDAYGELRPPLYVANRLAQLVDAYGELHIYVDPGVWALRKAQAAVSMMPKALAAKVHLYSVRPDLWPRPLA